VTDADRGRLTRALAEQGLAGDLLADVEQLVAWAPEAPRPEETRRLLAALTPHLPRPRPDLRAEFARLVGLALTQATVLRLGFWTGSAAVMLAGVGLLVAAPDLSRSLVLLLAGPLLAYLGTAAGFRGEGLRVLEVEFACPVTPRQLTIARLLVIVGYQTAVGMVLTALLSATGGQPWLAVTLLVSWRRCWPARARRCSARSGSGRPGLVGSSTPPGSSWPSPRGAAAWRGSGPRPRSWPWSPSAAG
jgi:hypothetical protein